MSAVQRGVSILIQKRWFACFKRQIGSVAITDRYNTHSSIYIKSIPAAGRSFAAALFIYYTMYMKKKRACDRRAKRTCNRRAKRTCDRRAKRTSDRGTKRTCNRGTKRTCDRRTMPIYNCRAWLIECATVRSRKESFLKRMKMQNKS